MKKFTFILVSMIMMLQFSCKKAEENFNEVQLVKKISEISNTHQKRDAISTVSKASRLSDYHYNIIAYDILGALNGGKIGSNFGLWGIGIGAVLVGGGLSYLAAFMPAYGEDECGNIVCLNCSSYNGGYNVNYLDNVGFAHNHVVLDALQNRTSVSTATEENGICTSDVDLLLPFIANSFCILEDYEIDSIGAEELATYKDVMEFVYGLSEDFYGQYFVGNTLEKLYDYSYITIEEKQVLQLVDSTARAINNYSEIIDYLKDCEDAIISAEVSQSIKDKYLVTFSVARHSTSLWFGMYE